MPFDQLNVERLGHFLRQNGFSGPGFSLDQERTFQLNRRIDCNPQIIGGDIILSAFKAHSGPR